MDKGTKKHLQELRELGQRNRPARKLGGSPQAWEKAARDPSPRDHEGTVTGWANCL